MNLVNVGYDSANYYVLEQNSLRVIIADGWPGTLPKLIHALQRKGLKLAELNYLLIIHYHSIEIAGSIQFPTSESRAWRKQLGYQGEIVSTPGTWSIVPAESG